MEDDANFLSSMERQEDVPRLKMLDDEAAERVTKAAILLNTHQVEAATDRTAFFDKISIGSGATIAAVVSFLGSRGHELNPRWMFRTALVSLLIAIAAALYRNFRFPYYLRSVHILLLREAEMESDKRRRALVLAAPNPIVARETGLPLDVDSWSKQLDETVTRREKEIADLTKKRERQKKEWYFSERISLVSVFAAMVSLACLAWWNF